jgi:hypothetical protein
MNSIKKGILCLAALGITAAVTAQDIAVTIDNKPIRFDGAGPRSVEGRVLVPLRGIFEAFGAFVEWVPSTRTVIAQKGNIDLSLRIGERTARVNGRDVLLDVPAQIMTGSTMVPLRFIGETLGADVRWENVSRTVMITTASNSIVPGTTNNPPITNNPPTGTGAAPTVTSIDVNSTGDWVRGNADVEIVLNGTPGAQASFEIVGVTNGKVSMREASPGRYVGTWRPRAGDNMNGATVLGYISMNGQERIIQASNRLSMDTTAPTIRSVIADRSRVTSARPTISFFVDDAAGSGIDVNTIMLRVDGQDRTRDAQINNGFVSYVPSTDLSAGTHRVELIARDKAGNEVKGNWTFDVADATTVVRSLTHTGTRDVQRGDPITVTLIGEPGGRATFNIGTQVTNRRMRETSPGTYVGEYVVRRGDVFTNEPITATLVTSGGASYTIESRDRIGVNAGPLGAPRITSPGSGETVASPFHIRGVAEPNSRVRVKVDYEATALGLLRLTGTVYDRILETDASGNFTTGDIKVQGTAGQRGTDYTVTVVSIDANGNESTPSTLKLKKQ